MKKPIVDDELLPYLELWIALGELDDDETLGWIDAIDIFEIDGDLAPLRDLLESRRVPRLVSPFLNDLVERLMKKKRQRRGNRKSPRYLLRDPETAKLSLALMRYYRLVHEGLSRPAAIDRTRTDARAELGLSISTAELGRLIDGAHSSLRRARALRRPA